MHVRIIRAALAALALCCCGPALAQVAQFQAIVVAACGSITLPTGAPRTPYMDQNGVLCTTVGSGGGGGGATGSVTAAGTSGTAAQAVQGINGGVPVAVSATSWPLPTGAATSANQATANGSLASIDSKTPAPVNGGQPVTVLNQAATGSQEQDVRSSGTLNAATANAAITIPINGQSTVAFTFSGLTASGATLSYEQSNDGGTTWTGVSEVNTGTGATSLTRTTDGQVRVAVQGRTGLRVRVSTTGTGTITVAWNVSVREGLISLSSPIPPGANTIGGVNVGTDGTADRKVLTTTTGALEPPTAGAGKKQAWFASLSANTNTQLVAANAARIGMTIQCDGSAKVAVSEVGTALSTATPASGAGITVVIPPGSLPFFLPGVTSRTAVTAYTATAQTCWGAEDAR